jgi:multicomponent Na+:H+ antiporter subunit E
MVIMLLAFPLAVLWTIVSGSISLDSLLVGYVLGVAILLVMQVRNVQITWRRLPDQIAAFLVYTLTLARDIVLSSVDVARRVLDPELPLNPGRISVPTQDETESDFIGAFSAHGITITPGELVVDFEDNRTMLVHCLDVEASAKIATEAQARRLRLLRRIKGDS